MRHLPLISATVLCVASLTGWSAVHRTWTADEAKLRAGLPQVKSACVAHYRALLDDAKSNFGTDKPMPQYYKDGKVDYGPLGNWISGFFPGSLWKLYDLTGEKDLRDAAVRYTDLLKKVTRSRQHDIGFMLYCPMGEALRLAPEKKSEYEQCLLEGANTLASLYRPDLGLIRSWPWGNHLVIIDNMMNLELLEWAAKNGERGTGNGERFHEIACSHARQTDRHHFRADGGAYHVLDYDPGNGDWVAAAYSKQGADLTRSSWSRGQGWATYGFTMMYRETGDVRFLVRAMKSADYAIDNPNMPADGIPPWDYGVTPTEGPVPRGEEDARRGIVVRAGDCDRDASAGALMASALLELAELAPPERGKDYRAYAVKTILSLASKDYFASREEGPFLIKHFASARPVNVGFPYLKQGNREKWFDCGSNYADYYFLEALQRFEKGCAKANVKKPSLAELRKLGYAPGASALEEMMLVKRRICPKEWMGPKKNDLQSVRKSMSPEGRWPDLDYAAWTKVNDAVCYKTHFWRAKFLARGYNSLHDRNLGEAAIKAVVWWIDNIKGRNPNWWPNEIGLPRLLCDGMLMVDDLLTDEQRAKVYDYLEVTRLDANSAGGNLADEAYIVMERAILGRDERLFSLAVREMFDEIKIAGDGMEGLQEDWSFHQHGPQQQMCTYGLAFLDPALRMASLLADTRWEMPKGKFALCCNMLGEGCRWMLWRDSVDVASVGRHFHHHTQRDKARAVKGLISKAVGLGWEFEKKEPVGFRYFHKSAHAVYRTEKFMFSMRGSTKSVHGLETHVMGMNKQGGHLTDGALFTYVTGNEYEDIYPLWNWRMLPGLTSYADLPPVRRNFMDEYNTSPNEIEDMDGGDTGDSRARLHFGFRRDGLSFVKDFEFSPKGVKVRVSGITSERTDSRVTTGIEQSLAQDDAKVFPWENGCVRAVNGGIEYRVYGPEGSIHGEIADRTGDWRAVNSELPSAPCSARVFHIWIDHGVAPKGASFSYEILPGM